MVGICAHRATANFLQVLGAGGFTELHEVRTVIQAVAHIGLVGLGGCVVMGTLVAELAILRWSLLSSRSTSSASSACCLAIMRVDTDTGVGWLPLAVGKGVDFLACLAELLSLGLAGLSEAVYLMRLRRFSLR